MGTDPVFSFGGGGIGRCVRLGVTELDAEGVSPFNKRIVETAMRSTGISPCEVEGYAEPERYEFFMPGDTEMSED